MAACNRIPVNHVHYCYGLHLNLIFLHQARCIQMLTTKLCYTVPWECKLFVILNNDEPLCRVHDKMIFLCRSFRSCSPTAHPSAFTSFLRNNRVAYAVQLCYLNLGDCINSVTLEKWNFTLQFHIVHIVCVFTLSLKWEDTSNFI